MLCNDSAKPFKFSDSIRLKGLGVLGNEKNKKTKTKKYYYMSAAQQAEGCRAKNDNFFENNQQIL